jgi:peptidoglycan hydrolase-like protein with peptidoglycan-binding domain
MRGCVRCAGLIAVALALCTQQAGAVDTSRMVEFAQNDAEPPREGAEPSQPPAANAPSAPRANAPEQIKKAQIELRRLDCFQGSVDGKLGNQTREAVKKFWTSAKQPAAEINITDELIAELSERGDNFCRPPRRFFGFGGRPGGNPAVLPFMPRGAQPAPGPGAPEQPSAPAPAQ